MYPASWRERYGEELEMLLAARPPSPRDVVDLAMGALDARLDPQLPGDEPRSAMPWTQRLPGLLAVAGGVLWIAGQSMVAMGTSADAYGWAAILLMVLSVLGGYLQAYARPILLAVGAVILCAALVVVLPWGPNGVPALAAMGIVGGGLLALAAIRAGMTARARILLVAVGIVAPIALAIPILMGVASFSGHPLLALAFLVPFGAAWIAVGLRLMVRGSQTLGETAR
jgi:hypothetical protein